MGNESITPMNFYGKLKPCIEMRAYVGFDRYCDLYLQLELNVKSEDISEMENLEANEKLNSAGDLMSTDEYQITVHRRFAYNLQEYEENHSIYRPFML